MIGDDSQSKYSFHMQVSARPMGSFSDGNRRSLSASARSAFVLFAKELRFDNFDLAKDQLMYRRRFDVRFTKPLLLALQTRPSWDAG